MNSSFVRSSPLWVLLAGSSWFSACGGDDSGATGDGAGGMIDAGEETGGFGGVLDASGGMGGFGFGGFIDIGEGTGGLSGTGGRASGDHFTPPNSLSDGLADEGHREDTLDRSAEFDCNRGMFSVGGVVDDVSFGNIVDVDSAAFSTGPGVETFSAQSEDHTVSMSWASGTADGATTLMTGKMTSTHDVEFCFEGAVRPRVDVRGHEHIVFAAETLFEVTDGACSTNVLAAVENFVWVCVATEPRA